MKAIHIVEFYTYGREITLLTVTGIRGNSTYENVVIMISAQSCKTKVEDRIGKSSMRRNKSMVLYTLEIYRANSTILYVTQNRSSPRLCYGPDCSANGQLCIQHDGGDTGLETYLIGWRFRGGYRRSKSSS